MKKIITTIICSCLTLGIYAQQSRSPKDITVSKLERKISKDIQLVDVRTAKEFKEGHIENAINIDVNSSDFEAKLQKLLKNKRVYVYCRSGKRSAIALKKMDSLGFNKLYNLPVGIEGWNKEKKKIELKPLK